MLILLMWSVRSRGCFRSTKPNSRGTSINTVPLSVSGCAHSPLFQERFFRLGYCYYRTPAAVEAEATLLLLSLPSLGFISFSVTLSSFASVRGGTERLYRGNHTQTPDKHTHPAATAMFVLTGSVFSLSLSLIHTLHYYTTCGLVVSQLTISVI